ncbi:MAG TPA: hypothetical protein VF179_04605 [Thermoanaerobaculia bacterium]|nr:hypothetical protein [Thermoanaerobaculia bacterium]
MDEKKTWFERHLALMVALVGIVSGLLSATLTNHLARNRDLEKTQVEMRQEAYQAFLDGQTMLRREPQKEVEANRRIYSAKFNILVIGPRSVICSMTSYWNHVEKYPVCPDFKARRRDAAIYQEMRRATFTSLNIPDPDLDAVVIVPYLWNCVLPGADLERVCATP